MTMTIFGERNLRLHFFGFKSPKASSFFAIRERGDHVPVTGQDDTWWMDETSIAQKVHSSEGPDRSSESFCGKAQARVEEP